jgi:hypothetical protein
MTSRGWRWRWIRGGAGGGIYDPGRVGGNCVICRSAGDGLAEVEWGVEVEGGQQETQDHQ